MIHFNSFGLVNTMVGQGTRAACRRVNGGGASFTVTGNPDDVTCYSCKRTVLFKNAVKQRAIPVPGKEPVSDHDRIFEQGWNQLLSFVDGETLKAGLSKRDTALLYRELANECRERAGQLDHEANTDDEEAMAEDE